MGGFGKLVLRDCMNDLIENVRPDDDGLLDWLYSKGWLTVRNRQAVRSIPAAYKQMAELVEILLTKDDGVIDDLIEFLEQTGGQEFLVRRLRETVKKHEVERPDPVQTRSVQEGDFALTYSSVLPIQEIVARDIVAIQDWSHIVDHFLTRAVDIFEARKERNPETAIRMTLERWIVGGGATFNGLLERLKARELHGLVENLEKARSQIKAVGGRN